MYESGFGRVIGVLIAPVKAFQSIAERPTWGAAMLVLLAVLSSVSYMAAQKTDFGDVMRGQLAATGREVPQETLDRQVSMMEKNGSLFAALSSVFIVLFAVVFAAVFLLAFKLLGSEALDFPTSLAVTLYSLMPLAVGSLLSIPIILSKTTIGYADMKRGGLLASSLAFLAPEGTSPVLQALLGKVDFFSLWTLALLYVGYRFAAKVSPKKAAGVVVGLWLLYVGIAVGWAALISSLGSNG
jgi:hypothetical protein